MSWRRLGAAVAARCSVIVLGAVLGVPGLLSAQETTFGAQPPGAEAAPAEASEGREEQFKDWVVRCGKPAADAPEICEMVQQQLDQEDRPVMAVAVGKLPNNPNPGMMIVLPLGIALPPGVELSIDGASKVPAPVQRCERRGCQIELLLEPELLARLKGGREAQVAFQVFEADGRPKGVGVPISLFGFTAALNEVMK